MENWCEKHQVQWKKTKKGNFSHPIKVGGELQGWCNMPGEPAAHPSTYEAVEPPLVIEAKKLGAVAIPSDPKNRSFALAYAKDLAMTGKIEVDKIKAWAIKFAKYMDTGE